MAGPGAVSPAGQGLSNPNRQQQSSNDQVKEAVEMALSQSKGAAKAIATFKGHSVNSMQELASKGKNDPNIHRVITNTISSPETSSLQMTFNGKAISIAQNSCTEMSKPKTGWFSGKKGTTRKVIEEKASKTKNPSIKAYYGPKGPATAFLDASYGLSQASEAIFKARTGKELESSVKKGLTTAVDGVIKLADKVTPDNAKDIAALAGTVQGLIDASGAKVDEKKITALKILQTTIDEFDNAKDVTKRTAEEIAALAKQQQQAA